MACVPSAAAHPIDDMCGMDRWACARRFTPPVDVARSTQGEEGQPYLSTTIDDDGAARETAAAESPPQPPRPRPNQGISSPSGNSRARDDVSAIAPSPSPLAQIASPTAQAPDRPLAQTIVLYLQLGFLHILPKGLDHILFVLSLFLASTRVRPLLIQITTFTIAHTITLALAASGLVTAPAGIVEPLIALSIAFVAIENIFFKEMTRWRPLVVFGFGLFHGLGFAGVLAELGLPQDQFAAALVSFNVGVEAGQLTVVGLALVPSLLLRRLLQREGAERLYRPIAVVPASVCIAVIGLWWAIERAFLGG